jgi:hypothetical protein
MDDASSGVPLPFLSLFLDPASEANDAKPGNENSRSKRPDFSRGGRQQKSLAV